jgi:predicted nucleotidyltransferase
VDTRASLVETLRQVLQDYPGLRLALLFGSQARGRARPDSDVDVAVEGEDLDLLTLAADLSLAAEAEVDVVDLSQSGYPLLSALLRDSLVLYEGEPYAAACWRTRAILQTETDRPWFERMRDAYLRRLAEGAGG